MRKSEQVPVLLPDRGRNLPAERVAEADEARFPQEQMLDLLGSIQRAVPDRECHAVVVSSCSPGAGVSSLIRELAITAAEVGIRVLICDATQNRRYFSEFQLDPPSSTLHAVVLDQKKLDQMIVSVPNNQISVATVSSATDLVANPNRDPRSFGSLLDVLRSRYQLILFDTPPVNEKLTATALARAVDGYVLVVEAEKTRVHSVQAARKSLERSGGRVLGLVLNKRRFHVPRAIYNLF